MSTAKKSNTVGKTTPTKGVTIARYNRSECNVLANDQRDTLIAAAP